MPPPERALVIGCGDGEAVLFLAREFPATRVRGVDSSPDGVREASARVGLDPEGRVAFKAGKPNALPFPNVFFDLVTQIEGRPHPAEIARVLRPGGHLILTGASEARLGGPVAGRLLRRGLSRSGIVPVQAGSIGDGNFLVGRLEEHR